MVGEIGSNFWLNPNEEFSEVPIRTPIQFNCKGNDSVWLSTGRSAIRFVIETIEKRRSGLKKVAVLPSFTCNTVIEPFLKSGYMVFYYPVEKDLRTTSDAILQTVIENDATIVLFHRYFGFDTLDGQVDKMFEILHDLGKYTIEDCTQCLYSDIHRSNCDFAIGSIRKWTGTPDGGFAVCREGEFSGKPQKTDVILEKAKVEASYAKYRYLFEYEGEKSEMLAMYRHAEDILDNQTEIYAISTTSVKVQSNLNIDNLKRKRRENFKLLGNIISSRVKTVFCLNNQEVPLYFPIIVGDRSALQKHLVDNAIYAPIVWPKDEQQPIQCEGAEYLYNHLLCIPIDQRYNQDDMRRIAKVIDNFYK